MANTVPQSLITEAQQGPPKRSASDEEKARYVVARYAAQNDHFTGFYKTWSKAINFLVGEHWRSRWDGNSLTWNVEKDIPPWHQQPVTNLTYAVYRTALAKLTKQKPSLEVVPPSGDSRDREAAELAESLLTYLWRLLKMPQRLPIALGWMLVTGMFFMRVGWDPEGGQRKRRTVAVTRQKKALADVAGPEELVQALTGIGGDLSDMEEVNVAADENGEPYTLPDGAIDYEREAELEPAGEMDLEVVSPLGVRLNPDASSMDDATEMYVGYLMPTAHAAKMFDVEEDMLRGANESAETRALYEDLMSASAAGFPRSWQDRTSLYGVSQQEAIGDRTLVVEFYAKQDDESPEGRHWITANAIKVWPPEQKKETANEKAGKADSAQLHDENDDATSEAEEAEETDFADGEATLPFGFWPPLVPCLDTPIPGQPTAIGLLTQVVPINEAINVHDGKIGEHHVTMAMGGKWITAPEDQDFQPSSEPAEVLTSKAFGKRGKDFAPFQADLKPLPASVYAERAVFFNKLQLVSGLSNLDLQQKGEGTPSGRSLLVTQEASDAVLMPTIFAMEGAIEEIGRRQLVIAQQKYREERTIAIRGSNGRWIYRSFKGADLSDGHDVRVQTGSMFPFSKSAQWDTRVQFLTAVPGLFSNPQTGVVDEQKLAKFMDVGVPGLEPFDSDENPDLLEIEREHAMFEAYNPTDPKGSHQIPQLAVWQNTPVHLKEHYNFMKRERERFDRWHPLAQAAFIEHMRMTAAAVSQIADQMTGTAQPDANGAMTGGPMGPTPDTTQPPAEAGRNLSLVPHGGSAPTPHAATRLTRGDFAAAGQ